MNPNVKNFLYRNPQYYELLYPEPGDETPQMCRRMFRRFLSSAPQSILDIGCGTGRDLASLAQDGAEGWGVDYLQEMIDYAKSRHPLLYLQTGDMRSMRLAQTFDVVMCMGSALMYALTNEEVEQTLDTFAAHSHKGTLLILDINNAACYLNGKFQPVMQGKAILPDFSAEYCSVNSVDLRRQLLIRKRTWKLDGCLEESNIVEDYCEYRLFFPMELQHLLEEKGFNIVGMLDNMELTETDLSGLRLYVAAIYGEA